jgi:hypothetical protein
MSIKGDAPGEPRLEEPREAPSPSVGHLNLLRIAFSDEKFPGRKDGLSWTEARNGAPVGTGHQGGVRGASVGVEGGTGKTVGHPEGERGTPPAGKPPAPSEAAPPPAGKPPAPTEAPPTTAHQTAQPGKPEATQPGKPEVSQPPTPHITPPVTPPHETPPVTPPHETPPVTPPHETPPVTPPHETPPVTPPHITPPTHISDTPSSPHAGSCGLEALPPPLAQLLKPLEPVLCHENGQPLETKKAPEKQVVDPIDHLHKKRRHPVIHHFEHTPPEA